MRMGGSFVDMRGRRRGGRGEMGRGGKGLSVKIVDTRSKHFWLVSQFHVM